MEYMIISNPIVIKKNIDIQNTIGVDLYIEDSYPVTEERLAM
jgi:hypothetical protein